MAADTAAAVPAAAAANNNPDQQQPLSPSSSNPPLDPSRLSSNNPFRNRLSVQPTSPPPVDPAAMQQFPLLASPTTTTGSKNPFLDPVEQGGKVSLEKSSRGGAAAVEVDDIFNDLSVSDKPAFANGPIAPKGPPTRSGTLPTQAPRPPLPDERREQRPPRDPSSRTTDSPPKRPAHRRHLSESSTMDVEKRDRRERQMDRGERPPRTESEERRRRERRREREERHRREKEKVQQNGGGKPKRPFRNLDLIDKLDLTGVYGQGLFHHDGPFDACAPSRNAKKDRRAPMQAFPEGSMNMALGGSGPNRSRLDLEKFSGITEQGFTDYNQTRKADTSYAARGDHHYERVDQIRYFNSTDRAEQVHGEESYGLGTSTFLEGARAPRSALQRRESEEQRGGSFEGGGGGLQRKKSLAQRLRGMSATRPRGPVPEGLRSPTSRYAPGTPVELTDNAVASATQSQSQSQPQDVVVGGSSSGSKALSAGGPSRAIYTKETEINPYDEAFEKKGTEIKFAEQEKPSSSGEKVRTPGSPRNYGYADGGGLSRALTADAVVVGSPTEEKSSGGGFLNRMKSLKGGGGTRRGRLERKDSGS